MEVHLECNEKNHERMFFYKIKGYLRYETSWCSGFHYCTTSFQQSLNSDSAQVQTLFAACQRFAMARSVDNGSSWRKGANDFRWSYHKNISSLLSSSSSSSSSSNDNYSTRFIWGTGSTFFISWKGHVPFSRYLSFCIFHHPMIYQICDVMMSIFWIYLLNHNSLSHQTWLIAI